jgi:hypothetical protein
MNRLIGIRIRLHTMCQSACRNYNPKCSYLRIISFYQGDLIMTEPEESDPFRGLDWATLEDWAGTRTLSRGREYQRDGHVHNLVRSAHEALGARVDRTERYATAVYLDGGLDSACTCPVGDFCNHAVAVVLEYPALCEKKITVPLLLTDDSRCMLLGIRPKTDPEQVPPGTPIYHPVPESGSCSKRPECWRDSSVLLKNR